MNRRSFMASILAIGMAPSIARAESLMRIVPRSRWLVRMALPFTYIGGIVESVHGNEYSYAAEDLILHVPDGARVKAIYVGGFRAGQILPAESFAEVEAGILIPSLDLTPHGNSIPELDAELWDAAGKIYRKGIDLPLSPAFRAGL